MPRPVGPCAGTPAVVRCQEDHTRAGPPEQHPGQPAQPGPQRGLELVADALAAAPPLRPEDVLVVDEELHEVDGLVDGGQPCRGPDRRPRPDQPNQLGPGLCRIVPPGALQPRGQARHDDPGREVRSAITDHEVGGKLGGGPRVAQRRRVGAHCLEGVAEGSALQPRRGGSCRPSCLPA